MNGSKAGEVRFFRGRGLEAVILTLLVTLALLAIAAAFALAAVSGESGPIPLLDVRQERRQSPAGEVVILNLRGEMEHTTLPLLQESFQQALSGEGKWAVLVMDKVRYMNSAAVSAVLDLNLRLQERGGACIVVAPSENVRLVLDTLGFTDRVFTVAADVDAAVAGLTAK
jgi:anti-anti-sigma factor